MNRTDPAMPVTQTAPIGGPPGAESAPSVESFPSTGHILIRDIDWKAYRQISDALGEHHHYRLSYDGRDLELMTKSKGHGRYGSLLTRFVEVLTEELGLPIDSCGDMTCDREDLEKAIEPDNCFYIENEPRMREKEEIDLSVDPPPDLGIEIDLTTDSRRRLGIYAAIRVPEIWRYEGRKRIVTICVLQTDGQYASVERSRTFPVVSAADLTRFVQRRVTESENDLVAAFREWIRAELKNQPE